jgi:hypothetical protein
MRQSLRLAWLVGAAAGLATPALAEDAPSPVLTETLDAGVYALRGSFDVEVGTHAVWQVLTDYDALPHFVHSIRTSVTEKRSGKDQLVTQEFIGKALIFTRDMHVRLDIHEQPERRIAFHDVLLKDFDVYRGSWKVQKGPAGAKVVYLLWAKPHGPTPASIARGAFKDAAVLMLTELRGEIVRRGAKQPLSRADARKPEGAP